MSAIAFVRATFADRAEAERIAETVVTARLAACANLSATESIFAWEGKVVAEPEFVGLFKTRTALAPFLAARIAALHSYDLPAITWWSVAADDRVVAWIEAETDA